MGWMIPVYALVVAPFVVAGIFYRISRAHPHHGRKVTPTMTTQQKASTR